MFRGNELRLFSSNFFSNPEKNTIFANQISFNQDILPKKKAKYNFNLEKIRIAEDYFSAYGINRTYVSLFSSAGVGCYGFKQNGFKCVATVELLKDRIEIQKANNKCVFDSGYICGDITTPQVKKALLNEILFWKEFGNITNVDVVFATPPCQGMSTANYKKSDNEQVRNSLVVEAIKLILDIRPKIFIFENVKAFMQTICTDIDGTDKTIKESIYCNLGKDYHISHKVINFMDYGVPSSRPRTIVIGTSKSIRNFSPLNLFPTRRKRITLRQAIGDLPSLSYGQRDNSDIYHFARKFPQYQEAWIENLKEGESAFSQADFSRHPYKIDKDGQRIPLKGAFMGNKYRRLFWDKPCACVATRNDQLASQDTIHPTDNRVLSIRELMRVMTIPSSFKWHLQDTLLSPVDYDNFLKNNELNIRRCIGEAVPTQIIDDISSKINEMLDFEDFVNTYKDDETPIEARLLDNFYIDTFLQEQRINNAKASGSFYTPQSVVYDAIKSVKISKDVVSILEPAVGLGAFLPQISSLFSESKTINIDAVELDPQVLRSLERTIDKAHLGDNVVIHYHNADFLEFTPNKHYDLIVSNPPYAKSPKTYPNIIGTTHRTKNLFALFLIKFLGLADQIACVIPKNFAIAEEFCSIRNLYETLPIVRLCDFGVKFFQKVFVEIISIHFDKSYTGNTEVVDYVNGLVYTHPQKYIFHTKLWMLYREPWFDEYIKKLQLDTFISFRDRQITNSKVKDHGKIRILRSKNILDNGSIIDIEGYDKYVDDISEFGIAKFLNSDAIIMPNFTYNTRATILPKNTLPNGSIAILIPKSSNLKVDLSLYATPEFRKYYSIVKSKSKFTLNIDNSSLYYIGINNG